MQFDELRIVLIDILKSPNNFGKYMSLKEICSEIEEKYKSVWNKISNNRNSIKSSSGIIYNYSTYNVNSFVESCLKYYSLNNGIPNLEQNEISSIDSRKKIIVWRIV